MFIGHLCSKQNCFYLKFQGPFKIPSSGCFEETDRVEAYRGFVSKNALLECVSQADRPVCLEVVAVQSARANTPSFRYLERFSDHFCLKYLPFPRVWVSFDGELIIPTNTWNEITVQIGPDGSTKLIIYTLNIFLVIKIKFKLWIKREIKNCCNRRNCILILLILNKFIIASYKFVTQVC